MQCHTKVWKMFLLLKQGEKKVRNVITSDWRGVFNSWLNLNHTKEVAVKDVCCKVYQREEGKAEDSDYLSLWLVELPA